VGIPSSFKKGQQGPEREESRPAQGRSVRTVRFMDGKLVDRINKLPKWVERYIHEMTTAS
jgi:hypothetical protein